MSERFSIKERFDWSQATVKVQIPAALQAQAWLHVSVFPMSWSYLAPQLHPESALASTYSACEGCPSLMNNELLQSLLQQWGGRVRVWIPVGESRDGTPRVGSGGLAFVNAKLSAYERQVNPDDCLFLEPMPNHSGVLLRQYAAGLIEIRPSLIMASCGVAPAPGAAKRVAVVTTRYDDVFSKIERGCRRYLGGTSGETRWNGLLRWEREYPVREMRVSVLDGVVQVAAFGRAGLAWGPVSDFLAADEIDCAPLNLVVRTSYGESFDPSWLGLPSEYSSRP